MAGARPSRTRRRKRCSSRSIGAELSVHYKRLEQEAYLRLSGIQDGLSPRDALEFAFAEGSIAEDAKVRQVEQWFKTWMSIGWFSKSNTKKD